MGHVAPRLDDPAHVPLGRDLGERRLRLGRRVQPQRRRGHAREQRQLPVQVRSSLSCAPSQATRRADSARCRTEFRVERFYPVRPLAPSRRPSPPSPSCSSSRRAQIDLLHLVHDLQSYFDAPRPEPSNLPSTISCGGAPFELDLPASSLGDVNLDSGISIMLMRFGFSTQCVLRSSRNRPSQGRRTDLLFSPAAS